MYFLAGEERWLNKTKATTFPLILPQPPPKHKNISPYKQIYCKIYEKSLVYLLRIRYTLQEFIFIPISRKELFS